MKFTKMNLVVDPEEMLPRVEKMIYAQAWKFSKQYPISFEEARSQAHWAFMKACYTFDSKRKAKFETWCYFLIWTRLKDMIMERAKVPLELFDLSPEDEMQERYVEEVFGKAPNLSEEFRESLEDLVQHISEDARDILSLLLETPEELMEAISTPRQLLNRTKKHLLALGKKKCNLESACLELQNKFQQAWA